MTEHTADEWRELHAQVYALMVDPETPIKKKIRAQEVMAMIRSDPAAMRAINETPSLQDLGWVEFL